MDVSIITFMLKDIVQTHIILLLRNNTSKNKMLPTKFTLIPILTSVHLILMNPATSCTPERSFSVARRIKTWLRSTMMTKRFNNLFCQFIKGLLTVSIQSILATNLLRNMMGIERTWVNLTPVICYDFLKYWLSICILRK